MIVEFALSLTLTTPAATAQITQVQFNEPVQQVQTYAPEGVLNVLSGLQLPSDTFVAFDEEFMDGTKYFGAFAVSKEFGYGYANGVNSIEAAREIALAECTQHADACLIYAEILPQNFVPLQNHQVSLSAEAAHHYRNPDPSWEHHRAMAISEDGAYSVVWNYGSPAEAAAAALSDCTGYLVTDLPNLRNMPCLLLPFK